MKRISTTIMGLAALVAMLVLGAFSAGAAQAHTFSWTGTTNSLLLVLADGPQSFTAIPGGNPVVCKHAHLDGTVKNGSQLTVTVLGQYTGCTAFLGFAATVTPVEYEISADETVSVINKSILIEVPELKCIIHIAPIANNQNLSKIRYLVDPSSSERLLAHAEVAKIHSVILGGAGSCGAEGLHTEGEYRGLLLAWVHGSGSLSWS